MLVLALVLFFFCFVLYLRRADCLFFIDTRTVTLFCSAQDLDLDDLGGLVRWTPAPGVGGVEAGSSVR